MGSLDLRLTTPLLHVANGYHMETLYTWQYRGSPVPPCQCGVRGDIIGCEDFHHCSAVMRIRLPPPMSVEMRWTA